MNIWRSSTTRGRRPAVNGGIALEDPGLYVEAHELAERGWLERRFVGTDREMAWFWSRNAEMALDLNVLTANRSSAVN